MGHLIICLPPCTRLSDSLGQKFTLLSLNHQYLKWCLAQDGPTHTHPSEREDREEKLMDSDDDDDNNNGQH